MIHLPRLAVGTLQKDVDRRPIMWALMHILDQCQLQVQAFLSRAEFPPWDAASALTGQPYRHLDDWLMSEAAAREFFAHGALSSDLAIVEGEFHPGFQQNQFCEEFSFQRLCQWLQLPRIAVVDAAQLSGCHLPKNLHQFDGVLLDCVSDMEHGCRLQTTIEALCGVPVLGILPTAQRWRRHITQSGEGAQGQDAVARLESIRALAEHLAVTLRLEKLIEIAAQRRFPSYQTRLFEAGNELSGLHVAVAYDEAFNRHFPDTLDLLELRGADVTDFSPLSDESLPEDVNLVILGAGRVARFASVLAANYCLKQSLFRYVSDGGRIYAEGGGLAYLGQQVVLENDHHFPMAGVLPSLAIEHRASVGPWVCGSVGVPGPLGRQRPRPTDPQTHRPTDSKERPRAEITLARSSWFGNAGWRLRGYLDSDWIVGPLNQLTSLAMEKRHRADLFESHQVIGSRLCVNFAAQQDFLERFFHPSVFAHLLPV